MPPKKRRGVRKSIAKGASVESPTIVYSEYLDSDDEKNSEDSVNPISPQKESASSPAALRRSSRRVAGNIDSTINSEASPAVVLSPRPRSPKARRGRSISKRFSNSPKLSGNIEDITIVTDSDQQSCEEHKDSIEALDKSLPDEGEHTDSSSSVILDEVTTKLNIINDDSDISHEVGKVTRKKVRGIKKKDEEMLDDASVDIDSESANNDAMEFNNVETSLEGNETVNKPKDSEVDNEVDDDITKLDEIEDNSKAAGKVDDGKGVDDEITKIDKKSTNETSNDAVKGDDSTNNTEIKMNIENEETEQSCHVDDDITELDETAGSISNVTKTDVEIKNDNEIIKVVNLVDDATVAVQVNEDISEVDVMDVDEVVDEATNDDNDILPVDETAGENGVIADETANVATDEVDEVSVGEIDNEAANDVEDEAAIEIEDEAAEKVDDETADEITKATADEIDDAAVDKINNETEDATNVEAAVEIYDKATEEIDVADKIDDVDVDEIEDVTADENDYKVHSNDEVEAVAVDESVNRMNEHEVDIANESTNVIEDGVRDDSVTDGENEIAVTVNEEFASKINQENEDDEMEVDDNEADKEDKNTTEEKNDAEFEGEVDDDVDDDIGDEIDDDIGIEVDDIEYEDDDDDETGAKTEANRTLESDTTEKSKAPTEVNEESVKSGNSESGIENMEVVVGKNWKDNESNNSNEVNKQLKAGNSINDQEDESLHIGIVDKSIESSRIEKNEGKDENSRNEEEKRNLDKAKDDRSVKDQDVKRNKVEEKSVHREGEKFKIKNIERNEKKRKLDKDDENVKISEAEYSRRISACDDIRDSAEDELIYEGEDSEEETESSQEDLMKSKGKKTKRNIDQSQLVINVSSDDIFSEPEDVRSKRINDKKKNEIDGERSKDLRYTNKVDEERSFDKESEGIESVGAQGKTKSSVINQATISKDDDDDDDDDVVILEDNVTSSKPLGEKSSKSVEKVVPREPSKTDIPSTSKNSNESSKESKDISRPVMKTSSINAPVKETDKKSTPPAKETTALVKETDKKAVNPAKEATAESTGSTLSKPKPTPAPAAAAAASAEQNKIPGRAYIIGIRGAASEGKKTLFDCVLCFDGIGNCVPGPIINKHIKSKEHALKVMEVTSQDLYSQYKNDDKTNAEDVVNAILKYEETQKRQTLVLATKDTYKAQRQLLVSKIDLIKQNSSIDDGKASVPKAKPNTDKLQLSKAVNKTNENIESTSEMLKNKCATTVNVQSSQVSKSEIPLRKRISSVVGSKPAAAPVPAALSTLNFLASFKGKASADENKSTEAEKKTSPDNLSKEELERKKYAAQETLSLQLAKRQKNRKPDKIVLVVDGRDVFVDTDKLGINVRVLRRREATFGNLFSFIKSDEWFGTGTMYVFLNGEYTCMRIRKHSMCSQYKCEIPVNVFHIEKELFTCMLIDESLKLHKEILDNTANDQALFCELTPINIDATNVLRIDRRVCFNTHPIDFHKKVPSYLMDRHLACIKEFNEFARKYAMKLELPFWDMMKSTFTNDVTDMQRTFIYMKKDGMSFKSADYNKRSDAIVAKTTALLERLRKNNSGINSPHAYDMKNKSTTVKGAKSFQKVVIFANCYYKEALKNFASADVEIFADEDLKFDSIRNFVSEKSKVMPQNTLWLTLIGSFCISEIKYLDACTSATSTCVKPLITLIPSPDVMTSSQMTETISKIRISSLALLKTVREIIPKTSAFFVLPPYPPTIISEYKYPHATLHKMASDNDQVYVASDMIIAQLGVAFSKLNKETISLILNELKERNYPHEPLTKYAQSLPQCHIQVVRTKEDSTNALFCKWKTCISELISKFLVTSPKNETEYLTRNILSPSKDLYDHFVFIGLQEQLSQISYSKNTSLSLWAIKPYDIKDIQSKVSSLLPLSGNRILFVIFGDFSMVNIEVPDFQCKTLKCTNAISYWKSRSEKVKVLIEEKLEIIRKLMERIKGVFKNTSSVVMAPLFPRYCVQKTTEVSETVHRTLHVVLKNSCNPCILDAEKAVWEERVEEFQDFWNSELLRSLDTCEPIRNLLENYLSNDIPLIQWIKPVVAPLNSKSAKYSIQGLFDKLMTTAYSKTSNIELPVLISSDLATAVNQSQGKNAAVATPPTTQAKEVNTSTYNNQTTSLQSSIPSMISTTSSSNSSYNTNSQPNVPPPMNYNYNYQMQGNAYNSYGPYYPQSQNSYPYYSQPPLMSMPAPYFPQPPYTQQPPPILPPQQLPVMPPQPTPVQPPHIPPVIPSRQRPPLLQSVSSGFNASSQSSYQYNSANSTTYSAPPALYSQPTAAPAVNTAPVSLIPTPPVTPSQVNLTSVTLPPQASHVPKSFPKAVEKPPTVSVPKKIQVKRPKAFIDFLLEFYSSSRKERPFEYAYIIGKKEMIHPLSELNLKNVTLIYQNLSTADEGQTSYILNKIGRRPVRSVCFLAFGLSVITKTLPLTPGCQKFKCKQPVPGSCLKSQSQDKSTNLAIIKRIKEIVLLGSKLSEYLPVVVLPIYPSRVFCDETSVASTHRICHAIAEKAEKDSYVLVGTQREWEEHIGVFIQTWNNFMKVHHDKYSYPKVLPKFPYHKDTITFGQSVNVFFDENYTEPAIWEDTVHNILKNLMTYTINVPKSLDTPLTVTAGKQFGTTATEEKETFVGTSAASAIADNVTTVPIKISNISDVVPEEFFTTLFTTIYKNASLEKHNDYFIVRLTRVSALLIVNKVNNFIIGDSAVKVEFAESQSIIPELTIAQDKYMASIFNEIYLRYKSQIVQNIKIKLSKVVDSSNYKTELCDGSCNGETSSCNFYHSSNDRRRNPIVYKYMQKMCPHPNTKYNPCPSDDKCVYAHNIYEQMFYPSNFQTIICPMHDKNTQSNDGICKFAHADTPEVFFTSSWTDLVVFGTQSTFHFVVGAIRSLQKLAGKKDVKICLLSLNVELLDIVEQVIGDMLSLSGRKCANLLKTLIPPGSVDTYDVFLGNPYSVALSQSQSRHSLLSVTEIGALIVDDINGILSSALEGEHLLKICKTLRIGAGQKSQINKVFVANTYSSSITGVVSRFLGIHLKEVKEQAKTSTLVSVVPPAMKETPATGTPTVVLASSSSSRSGSREKQSLQTRKTSTTTTTIKSRKSRSNSRSRRHRSGSRSRKNRSRSRSRKLRSRSRSRRRSGSRTRRRSSSRSRRNRSSSRSRRNRNRSRSKSISKTVYGKRVRSPSPALEKAKKMMKSLSEQFSYKGVTIPNIGSTSAKPSELMSSLQEKFGKDLYRKYMEEQKALQHTHDEEYRAFKAFPELHSSYEMFYEEFISEYNKKYGRNTREEQKDQHWRRFWDTRIQMLKDLDWKKKSEKLEKEFSEKAKIYKPVQSRPNISLPTVSKSLMQPAAKTETFSVEKIISLLEQLSSKMGMLGPALTAIISSARDKGINDNGLAVFTDEENLVLIKMVTDKMKSLQKTSPPSLVAELSRALDWTARLLEYAKNPPKKKKEESSLNLMAIARASLGKDSAFTLNLIKTALAYEGLTNKSKEEINELFLEVCKIHFEMAMPDK